MSLTMKTAQARTQGAGPAGADQGGFFSFLGGLAQKALPFIPVVGAPAAAALGLATGGGRRQLPQVPPSVQRGSGFRNTLAAAIPGGRSGLVFKGGKGQRIVGVESGGTLFEDVRKVPGCPTGMHPNKSSYYRRDGSGNVIFIPAGFACVKNRRRNSLNPRALTKAVGRVTSAKRANKILGRITIRKA